MKQSSEPKKGELSEEEIKELIKENKELIEYLK